MKGSQKEYSFGYGPNMVEAIKTRTFEKCAKFLEPYLTSEMSILDCGCGPGSITIGFAERLKQGKVMAVDIEPSQVELTRQTAEKAGFANIDFRKCSILNLPFEDNSFDVAYTNAVICQLEEYKKAIAELYRVVKPGGVVGIREVDHIQVIYPENQLISQALDYRIKSMTDNGVQLYIGRKLRQLFQETGFKEVIAKGSVDSFSDENSIRFIANFYKGELTESPHCRRYREKTNVSLETIKQYQQAWEDFSREPGAFYMFNWVETIGIK